MHDVKMSFTYDEKDARWRVLVEVGDDTWAGEFYEFESALENATMRAKEMRRA